MAYTITLTNGTTFATITDGTVNTASSMTLVGKNYAGYGQFLDENFIHLLENSAAATAPAAPLAGQIWWDSGNTLLKVYSGAGGWKVVGGATASSSQPSPSVVGDLWYDTVNQQLKVCSVAGSPGTFIVVGPAFSNSQGTSGAIPLTISDGTTGYVVTGLYANNNLVGIISAAADFVPAGNSAAFAATFPRIYRGFTVYNSGNASGNISNPGNINFAVTGTVIETIASTGAFVNGVYSASGNVIGGNIRTAGLVTATGNVTGGNLTSAGVLSVTSNVIGGNLTTAGVVTSTGNVIGGNINTGGLVSATGNVVGGNIRTAGVITATGNITGGNILFGSGIVTGIGNVVAGNVLFGTGNVSGTGNVAAGFFIGNGSQLTGLSSAVSVTKIENGTSVVQIGATGGNANVSIGGTANVAVFDSNGAILSNVTVPSVTKSGTNAVGNIGSASNFFDRVFAATTVGTTVSVTGNIDSGNLRTTGLVTASGNVTGGNLLTAGQISATGNITTSGVFIGTFSGNISGNLTVPGSNTQILFNNNGNAGASAAFTFNSATNIVSATGNVVGGNLSTAGLVTATGNVTGGNVNTGGLVTAAGNVTGANLNSNGLVTALGNVIGANFNTGGLVTATGNVTGGNLLTGGLVSAVSTITSAANITGGNLLTGGLVTATANVIGGNLITGGLISATGNVTGGNVITTGAMSAASYSASGNVTGGNVITTGAMSAASYSASGNITGANLNAGGLSLSSNVIGNLNVTGNIAGGNVVIPGLISATGNVSGNFILGNGALLTGVITSVANINNGTSNVTVVSSGGNVTVGVGGTSNVAVFATSGLVVTGTSSATGNVIGGNLRTGGIISAVGNVVTDSYFVGNFAGNITGNITVPGSNTQVLFNDAGNAGAVPGFTFNKATLVMSVNGNILGNVVSASGNVTGGNILTGGLISATGAITVNAGNAATAIVNGAANAQGNIGSSTGYFNRIFAQATTALYADVAERFAADEVLDPGTVVELGGVAEITKSRQDLSENVFGVISTNAAYLMNGGAGEDRTHPPVAMTGRVPVQVVGQVRKGDRLVSAGNGKARAARPGEATAFNTIGRALADKVTDDVGSVEAIVTIK